MRGNRCIEMAAAWLGASLLSWGCGGTPVVILHQVHTFENTSQVDSLLTYVSRDHVLIAHRQGRALLDFAKDRMFMMDPPSGTYRQVALSEWEKRLAEAAAIAMERNPNQEELRFERKGKPVEIAGFLCDRYVVFTRREILPGDVDYVERQIWVARDLELPEGAYESYARGLESVQSVDLGGLGHRPEGVILQMETVTTPEGVDRRSAEIERDVTYKVERKKLSRSFFRVPSHYVPAGASTNQPGSEGQKPR